MLITRVTIKLYRSLFYQHYYNDGALFISVEYNQFSSFAAGGLCCSDDGLPDSNEGDSQERLHQEAITNSKYQMKNGS
jgi:hypothetical protein